MRISQLGIFVILLSFSTCKKEKIESLKNEIIERDISTDSNILAKDSVGLQKNKKDKGMVRPPAFEESIVKEYEKKEEGFYEFRYLLEKGDVFPLKIKTTTTSEGKVGKQNLKTTETQFFDFLFKISELSKKAYDVEILFQSYAESIKTDQGSLSIDTKAEKPSEKEAEIQWKKYKTATGKKMTAKMDLLGNIYGLSGMETVSKAVLTRLKNEIPPEASAEQKDALLKNLERMVDIEFSNETYTALLNSYLMKYKEEPLKIGESWKTSDSTNAGGGKGNISQTTTLKEIKDGNVNFELAASLKNDGTQSENGLTLKTSINSNTKGKALIEESTGWPKHAEIETKTKQTSALSNDTQSESQTVSITTIIKVN